MKIFVICQVRLADKDEISRQKLHVEFYERLGHEVCWPPRDTEQEDPTGLGVCEANFRSMQQADIIHLLWSGGSDGLHFDLGMAFAMGKPIIPFNMPMPYPGKSFSAMILHYFDTYGFVGAQLPRLGEVLRANHQQTQILPDEEITNNEDHQEEAKASAPLEPGRSLLIEIFKYLHSHGAHAVVRAEEPAEPNGTPEIWVATDIMVSGGEKEHIQHMAKGYKVQFRVMPDEKEEGAC